MGMQQENVVSMDIITLPRLVLEEVVSNLDFVDRNNLMLANKFFNVFVPTVVLHLNFVRIQFLHGTVKVSFAGDMDDSNDIIAPRTFKIQDHSCDLWTEFCEQENSEDDQERLREYLDKLLNNKMIKIGELLIEDDLNEFDKPNDIEEFLEKYSLQKYISLFPSQIRCQEVHIFTWYAKEIEELLKRMKMNMDHVEFFARSKNIPESLLRIRQFQTAQSVYIWSSSKNSTDIIEECKSVKKIHIDGLELDDNYKTELSVRNLLKSWLSGDCIPMRELTIQIYREPMFSSLKMFFGLPNIRMTNRRYERSSSTLSDKIYRVFSHTYTDYRVDKLAFNSLNVGHATICINECRYADYDRFSEEMCLRFVNGDMNLENIQFDDNLFAFCSAELIVTFEDY